MNPIDLPIELLVIPAVEDSFVAAIKASSIATLLRQVDTLPADLSPKEVGDRLRNTPGAFVAFGGGPGLTTRRAGLNGNFTVFCITGQGAAEAQRRRGSKVMLGAYSLLQALITALHGNMLPAPSVDGTPIPCLGMGAPQLTEATRYWSEDLDALGLTIYGATFSVQIEFPPALDSEDMADFLTFLSQIDITGADHGGESPPLPEEDVSSEDIVTLPT